METEKFYLGVIYVTNLTEVVWFIFGLLKHKRKDLISENDSDQKLEKLSCCDP